MKLLILFISILFLPSCATRTIKKKDSTSYVQSKNEIKKSDLENTNSNETMGPALPPPQSTATPVVTAADKNAEYAVILGPGFAKSLAHIGVLKALEEKEFKIRAIVGVDFSSVIATSWANTNANKLEWDMFKFDKETVFEKKLMGSFVKQAEGKNLEKFLSKLFGTKRIEDFKLKTYVAVADPEAGSTQLIGKGLAQYWTRAALGVPGTIKPVAIDGRQKYSSVLDNPFPTEALREKSPGKVLCVDVLGASTDMGIEENNELDFRSLLKSIQSHSEVKLKTCDAIIRVNTSGIGALQYEAKADLVFKGKEAANEWLEKEYK